MSKSLVGKVVAIGATHLIFNVTMFFAGNPVASASAISQALKWLSFGTHEQYGVWTLISIAFKVNSFLKRIL
jgi:hypothetical protein